MSNNIKNKLSNRTIDESKLSKVSGGAVGKISYGKEDLIDENGNPKTVTLEIKIGGNT